MDLYHKKVNIGNKPSKRNQDKYPESDYNPSKNKAKYLHPENDSSK